MTFGSAFPSLTFEGTLMIGLRLMPSSYMVVFSEIKSTLKLFVTEIYICKIKTILQRLFINFFLRFSGVMIMAAHRNIVFQVR